MKRVRHLSHAAQNADIGTMQLLLQNGANVNAENRTKATPLIWALHDPDKVKLLLHHGAISLAATCWARMALALLRERAP
jgi:ankyrin repeat protein